MKTAKIIIMVLLIVSALFIIGCGGTDGGGGGAIDQPGIEPVQADEPAPTINCQGAIPANPAQKQVIFSF